MFQICMRFGFRKLQIESRMALPTGRPSRLARPKRDNGIGVAATRAPFTSHAWFRHPRSPPHERRKEQAM
jgi:hypothetical protein